MTANLRLHDLGPSPNNKKVRLALGYKGLAYEKIPVNPEDRSDVIKVSGQPLAPVLVHGSTVIFDSGAILRYLEANVKREPRLFSSNQDEMSAIEKWEGFARTKLAPPVGALFGQCFAPEKDRKVISECGSQFNAACKDLEAGLNSSGNLVGSSTTAADVSCAAWVASGTLAPTDFGGGPIVGFFSEHLRLDPQRTTLRRWLDGINRYDR